MQIDKNKIYEVGKYTFHNLIDITEEDKIKVLEWRNNPIIRRFMYNKEEIAVESHLKFVDTLRDRKDCAYWLVLRENNPIGVLNLTGIHWETSKAEIGYYMVPDMMNSGFGIEFVYSCFMFAYKEIGVTEIYGAIQLENKNAILMDTYMGGVLGETKKVDGDDCSTYIEFTLTDNEFFNNHEDKLKLRNFVRYAKNFKMPEIC